MSSVHLETTDQPSWVSSGSHVLWPGSPSSVLSISPTLCIPGSQGTELGPPGLPSKHLVPNSPTPSSLGSKQYNFKQRLLPQPWGKYWANFSALLTVYFFIPTLSAKIEPEGLCLLRFSCLLPGLPGAGKGAHIHKVHTSAAGVFQVRNLVVWSHFCPFVNWQVCQPLWTLVSLSEKWGQ